MYPWCEATRKLAFLTIFCSKIDIFHYFSDQKYASPYGYHMASHRIEEPWGSPNGGVVVGRVSFVEIGGKFDPQTFVPRWVPIGRILYFANVTADPNRENS
uniref:Uncharacterized protein n=1 Tax=Romanomermis culicivorax TaxID=13658 RepID=A0A915HLM3_ROMCU